MKVDVVVVNILVGLLCELVLLISVLFVLGGLLGFFGIFVSQVESVCEVYVDFFVFDLVVEKEEWCWIIGWKN